MYSAEADHYPYRRVRCALPSIYSRDTGRKDMGAVQRINPCLSRTLDGFFEGPKKWDLDWHDYVWGEALERIALTLAKAD